MSDQQISMILVLGIVLAILVFIVRPALRDRRRAKRRKSKFRNPVGQSGLDYADGDYRPQARQGRGSTGPHADGGSDTGGDGGGGD